MIYNGNVMSPTLNLRAKAEAAKAALRASATPLEVAPETAPETIEEYVPAEPAEAYPELGYYADNEYPPFQLFEHTPKIRVLWYIVISPVWVPTRMIVAAGRRLRRSF